MTAGEGNVDIASQTPAQGRYPKLCPACQDGKERGFGMGTHSQLRKGLGRRVWKGVGVLFRVNDVMPSQVQGKAAAAVCWFFFP